MDLNQVALMLALLACVAIAITATIVGAWLGDRMGIGVATRVWSWVRATLDEVGLVLALAMAAVTMAGSLYFSEIADLPPCRLCWYQRICAYPLVLLLAVAVARRSDRAVRPYVAALCAVGAPISAYHVAVERMPSLETSCDPINPCSVIWVEPLGIFTIPTMALCAFVAIAAVTLATPARRGST